MSSRGILIVTITFLLATASVILGYGIYLALDKAITVNNLEMIPSLPKP